MKRETELSRMRKEEIVMQLKGTDANKREEVLKLLATEIDPLYELLNTSNINLTTNMINKLTTLFHNEDNLDLKYMEIDKLISIGIIGENSAKILDYLYNIIYNPNPKLPHAKEISEYIIKTLIDKRTACMVLSNYVKSSLEPTEEFLHKIVRTQNAVEQDRRSEPKSEEPIQMAPDEKLQLLINELSNSDIQTRITAIHELGKIGSNTAVSHLINVMNPDSDIYVREAAALALMEKAPDEATQCLIDLLRLNNLSVSISIAKALGEINSDRAVQFLADQLTNVEDTFVLGSIIEALGTAEPSKVIEALRKTTSDAITASWMVNKTIKIAKPILDMLNYMPDEYVKRTAIKLLVKILPPQEAEEILIMNLSSTYSDVKIAAIQELEKIASSKSEEPLIKCLSYELDHIRIIAAKILGNLKSKKAIKTLIDILSSDDHYNIPKLAALKALVQISPLEAIEPLINALRFSNDMNVKITAAQALRKIAPEEAVQPLINALYYPNIDIKIVAAEALGKIALEAATLPLSGLLSSDKTDDKILEPAYEALWKIGTETSIKLSVDLLNYAIRNYQHNKIDIFAKIIKKHKNKLDIYIDKLFHIEKLSACIKESPAKVETLSVKLNQQQEKPGERGLL